jgi:hypothetical protein
VRRRDGDFWAKQGRQTTSSTCTTTLCLLGGGPIHRTEEGVWEKQQQQRPGVATPTWVAEGAADGVAALEQELDDPRRDEAAGARHAHHLRGHLPPCRPPS